MQREMILAAVLGITVFLAPTAFAAAPDASCLNTAVTDRSKSLKDAYKQYSDDMGKAVDAMTKGEQDAIKNKDTNYVASDTSRAFANFSYSVGDLWNRLNVTMYQAWSNYYGRRASCGYGGSAAVTAPPSYGGGYGYNYGYGGYGQFPAQCSTPVLTTPQPGCYYECAPDENGCQRCHQACRTAVSYSSCGCSPVYDPVCSRSGRTYDNACIAVCTGEQVWYSGSCR